MGKKETNQNDMKEILYSVSTDHLVDLMTKKILAERAEKKKAYNERHKLSLKAYRIVNADLIRERAKERNEEKEKYFTYIEEHWDKMKAEVEKLREENKFLKSLVLNDAKNEGKLI